MMEPFTLSLFTPAVRALIDRLKPSITTLVDELSTDLHAELSALFNLLGAYLEQSYERHSFFSTVVFPNEQLKLGEYYQPLTLVDPTGQSATYVDHFPNELLTNWKDLLVVDTAGMGKSTLFKYLFLTSVEETTYIPVIIELRRLSPTLSVEEYINKQIQLSTRLVDCKIIHALMRKGMFLFLFDGFDEVVQDYRNFVINQIQDLKQWANNCTFVLSSRELPELTSFADFKRFQIQQLIPDEAFSLIRKYGKAVDTGELLINEIQGGHLTTVAEFLGNPLLVSLLYRCYEYKQQVPLNRTVFYRQVFESLFESHDLRKPGGPLARPKKTGLDISAFEALTQTFAFVTYQAGKSEYTADEFISFVKKATDLQPQLAGITPHDYLSDLTVQVPLFTQDGNNYRWIHRSIQEYFCALAVCHNTPLGPDKVLPSIYRSSSIQEHINLLILYSELDRKGFRRYFVKLLLSDIEKHLDTTWQHLPEVGPDDLALRRSLMFDSYVVVAVLSKEDEKNWLRQEDHEPGITLIPHVFEQCRAAIAKEFPDLDTNTFSGGCPMWNPTLMTFHGRLHQLLENMPSLEVVKRFGNCAVNRSELNNIEDVLPKLGPDFYLVTDSPSNFLNSTKIFEAINSLLLRNRQWQIDEAMVRATLSEIRAEELRDNNYPLNF